MEFMNLGVAAEKIVGYYHVILQRQAEQDKLWPSELQAQGG